MMLKACLFLAAQSFALSTSEPPPLSDKPEAYEKYFNMSLRDGHQQDGFVRRVMHLYNNLEGEGAIRDGIRAQEETISRQPGGRPDPAQATLHETTLRADEAIVALYGRLRADAALVEEGWNLVRDARGQIAKAEFLLNKDAEKLLAAAQAGKPHALGAYGIEGALENIEASVEKMQNAEASLSETQGLVARLLPFVDEAARWHADSHRAAGGSGGGNPTAAALKNAASAARQAMELGARLFAVMRQLQGDTREKILAATEAETLVRASGQTVNAAAGSEDEAARQEAEASAQSAVYAAGQGAGAKAGCAACAAKAAARAFGTKNEAATLPELASFTSTISSGERASSITADGSRKASSVSFSRLKRDAGALSR